MKQFSPRAKSNSTWPTLLYAQSSPSPCVITFKESAANSGFDNNADYGEVPPWLIVPLNGTNTAQAEVAPASEGPNMTFAPSDTSKATVSPAQAQQSPQQINVTGKAASEDAVVTAQVGSQCSANLRIAVKAKRTITLKFWYAKDQGGHATSRPKTQAFLSGLVQYFNSVFNKQANVEFAADTNSFPDASADGNLGDPCG